MTKTNGKITSYKSDLRRWRLSRRELLKTVGAAGLAAVLPPIQGFRSTAFAGVEKVHLGLPSNQQYPDWVAEARIPGFPISGVMVDPASMEIALDRRLADKRVFPAIDIKKSGTRKEELLLDDETLNRVWILRKLLSSLNTIDSLEFLLDKMSGTDNNKAFLQSMNA